MERPWWNFSLKKKLNKTEWSQNSKTYVALAMGVTVIRFWFGSPCQQKQSTLLWLN
jgi:hypothetical protein